MQRYFLTTKQLIKQPFYLDEQTAHHLVTVLRAEVGTQAEFVQPDQLVYLGHVSSINQDGAQAVLDGPLAKSSSSELPVSVSIACGLPKGEKAQLIVQKATELGVHEVIFFTSQRSIAKWPAAKRARKLERLQQIAQNAAEQSHRNIVPVISYSKSLSSLLDETDKITRRVVAWEEAAKQNEKSQLAATFSELQSGDSLLAIFGPEGGLTSDEVAQMQQKQVIVAGLGPRILRTETAPLYLLAAASYYFELED
ncbi:16S rRNA methyltransferase [Paucilactobacillus hokkaidonensis JCM 18461]|uniref:Ribosomal RNA small subunit methyltransferase E n=2 Tax=Paucilactobacillus hokkaidonensis TaxID=1193095 RepID=A0A0A1GZ25_9LACO|nr:16S rRNA (uracil(1498)-N(3))-methyltransferase [Paucilactobacillus hokkaidonensis]KRO10729.1 RsmE family RNA methyltransferase [Paucilactobacillus hokkaidonensis]BAP85721.1 16S rRNA methyltransferase [Paucilactobacillus hokkaidonensis JCM 18461]